MTAEIELSPDQEQAIRDRFGVGSAEARKAEAEWFRKAIESDGNVHKKWRMMVDRCKRELRGRS